MMSSHSALEDRANHITEAIASIQKSIKLLESSGEIAPPGCCIVHYQARGNKKHYWYYKLQASEPIFPTKSGKMTERIKEFLIFDCRLMRTGSFSSGRR